MIKYSLVCSNGHEFEGWFSAGEEYDRLEKAGHLACAVCGNGGVSKTIMAPSVNSPKKRSSVPVAVEAGSSPESAAKTDASGTATVASLPPQLRRAFIEQVRAFRKQVTESAEDVGDRFAEEARKIHYGEAQERGIYGQARAEDAAELVEEGIDVYPLPELPEDRN
ncbi:DUF1178 family protein [Salaquimonas pukyongi]|uniref:DUF1178 family protein n=1 Tax=Salaquimonas pukyongi TaxID=2712698 RepID=UPI00096B7DFE|nr:DUF1178 family protein [Salaquimonas pukyongi]